MSRISQPVSPIVRCPPAGQHSLARSLGLNWDTIQIDITIGVQEPDTVDTEAVKAVLSGGQVSVKAVKGGLDVLDRAVDDRAVIATAAIEVMVELP